jgi:hypothetical protein
MVRLKAGTGKKALKCWLRCLTPIPATRQRENTKAKNLSVTKRENRGYRASHIIDRTA